MKLDKKDTKQTIFIIMFSALMLWAVLNYKLFIDLIKFIFKLLMPLIVGIAIAFIVNVPMKQLERKIFKVDKRKHKKLVRLISLFLSIILIFGIVFLVMFLIVPEFIEAIINISKNLPKSYKWINVLLANLTILTTSFVTFLEKNAVISFLACLDKFSLSINIYISSNS